MSHEIKIADALENILGKQRARGILRPLYRAYEDFVDGGVVKKNETLKNLYAGQRCFILGTGVSLNEIDLTKLAEEYTFGCGGVFAHKNFKKLNIAFYADTESIWSFSSKGKAIDFYSRIDQECTNPNTIFFLRAANKKFFERHKIFQGRRAHYVKSSMPMELAAVQSNDLAKRITFLDGSVFFMIAAAIYMGFKELYLCGCGYTFQPQLVFHFHDEYPRDNYADFLKYTSYTKPVFPRNISAAEKARRVKKIIETERVAVYSTLQEGPYEIVRFVKNEPVDKKHEIMKKFAESMGVKIFNIVPDGFESPVYQKVSWDYVLKQLL